MTLRSFLAGVRESIEQGVDSINKWTRDPRQVKLQERLQHIFKNLVIYAPEGFIQHASVPHLEVLPFDPENPSSSALHFFLPWSTSRLAQHQTNFVLNDTGERIESTTEIMSILNDSAVREGRPHDMEEFDWLVKRLIWEVETYPRHGTKDDAEPLRVITKWKISNGLNLHPGFEMLGFTGYKRIMWQAYKSWTFSPKVPHVKVVMAYLARTHPDRLFKAELMVILAVMASRLKMRSLRKHAIIPVMLFSFSGLKHGRILTAHFDGKRLMVFRSRPYPFFPEDLSNLNLFTRYLASDVKPYGETQLWK